MRINFDEPNQQQRPRPPALVDEFNKFFFGDAEVRIEGDNLHVTVLKRTMTIRLPHLVGVESTGQ